MLRTRLFRYLMLAAGGCMLFQTGTSCKTMAMDTFFSSVVPALTSAFTSALTSAITGAVTSGTGV
jgi:hypothetical protein